MRRVLINVFILLCTRIHGQLTVDTELSVKDSIIIVTLQNESDYRIVVSNRAWLVSPSGSEVKFLFINVDGDTIRGDEYIYWHTKYFNLQPVGKIRC